MAEKNKHAEPDDDPVEAALKEVERAESTLEKLLAREKAELAKYEAARTRAKGSKQKRLSNAVLTARQRATEATKLKKEAAANLREARTLLREQKQLAAEGDRKERARERAVATFLKKWEREYDLDMKRKKKNIKLRKQEIRRS